MQDVADEQQKSAGREIQQSRMNEYIAYMSGISGFSSSFEIHFQTKLLIQKRDLINNLSRNSEKQLLMNTQHITHYPVILQNSEEVNR